MVRRQLCEVVFHLSPFFGSRGSTQLPGFVASTFLYRSVSLTPYYFLISHQFSKLGFLSTSQNFRRPPIPWNSGAGWTERYCNCILEKTLSLTARNLSFGVRGRGKTLTWCQVTAFSGDWLEPMGKTTASKPGRNRLMGILEEDNHFSAIKTGPLQTTTQLIYTPPRNVVRGSAVLQNLLGCFFLSSELEVGTTDTVPG